MDSYTKFAKYYDVLTSNVDYKKIAGFIDETAGKYGLKNSVLLDLGCGTGSLSEEVSSFGYDVIGVDFSPDMLSIAMDKKYESGLDILYVCQDMTKLELYGTVGITVSMLDCINHLKDINSVKKTFENVSKYTEKGGLFIFDMNTIYKHCKVLSSNSFVFETDEVFCTWQNSYEGKGQVDISLDFFEEDNGVYTRFSESFSEIAYEISDIDKVLVDTGFEVLFHKDFETLENTHDKSEKIFFVARKV